MKKIPLIIGIAIVAFANVCDAKSIAKKKEYLYPGVLSVIDNKTETPPENTKIVKPHVDTELDELNPDSLIPYVSKSINEVIAENDKIIENEALNDLDYFVYEESMKDVIAQFDLIIENSVSNETYPLFYERTPADEVVELEKIIESTVSNEIMPLDFKKINSVYVNCLVE